MASFIIRMADGRFFADLKDGRIITTSDCNYAQRFRNRWLALQQAAAGQGFSGAYILPYVAPEPEGKASIEG
ncbi:MAG TPA: hypothetical protein VGH83_05560 [Candidatus Acidoferrum sp.]